MEYKQTAIEWLEENLNFEPYDEEEFISNNKIWEQAKLIEKEQITDSYGNGLNAHRTNFCNREEYYNKIYGKDNL